MLEKVKRKMKDEVRSLAASSSKGRSGPPWKRQTRADNGRETPEGNPGNPENQKDAQVIQNTRQEKRQQQEELDNPERARAPKDEQEKPRKFPKGKGNLMKTSREGHGSGNGKRTNEG